MRGLREIRQANEQRIVEAALAHQPKKNPDITVVPGQMIEDSVVLIQSRDVMVVPFEHIDEVCRAMNEVRDEIKARRAATGPV